MRAEGLIPALSGVCWFLLPVGWCSVVSAACEHQQFKQQVILTIRPSNNYTNTLHMGQFNRVATAWQRWLWENEGDWKRVCLAEATISVHTADPAAHWCPVWSPAGSPWSLSEPLSWEHNDSAQEEKYTNDTRKKLHFVPGSYTEMISSVVITVWWCFLMFTFVSDIIIIISVTWNRSWGISEHIHEQ